MHPITIIPIIQQKTKSKLPPPTVLYSSVMEKLPYSWKNYNNQSNNMKNKTEIVYRSTGERYG